MWDEKETNSPEAFRRECPVKGGTRCWRNAPETLRAPAEGGAVAPPTSPPCAEGYSSVSHPVCSQGSGRPRNVGRAPPRPAWAAESLTHRLELAASVFASLLRPRAICPQVLEIRPKIASALSSRPHPALPTSCQQPWGHPAITQSPAHLNGTPYPFLALETELPLPVSIPQACFHSTCVLRETLKTAQSLCFRGTRLARPLPLA